MKKLTTITAAILAVFFFVEPVSADVNVAGSSAQIRQGGSFVDSTDYRVVTLKNYLESHNSPLAPYTPHFIEAADRYDLDWRLVPAIAGVESTFGKRIPYNSYNAYGWANGKYRFSSWNESINIVSKTLRENYIDRGAVTISEISRIYAPPSTTWAYNVKYFMRKIDPLPLSFTLES